MNSEFHHWPHLRHCRSLNSSSLLKLIWEPITWSFGRDSLNLETVSKLILTVDLILENFCSGIHGVCMCVCETEGEFKNSCLYCSWKLTVRQSQSHDKNECRYRSCLHKTEILFSQSNISPASWQIFSQKASHLLLEPHSNFAARCLHCCFSSWPVIKGICVSVILHLSNKVRVF